MALFPLSMSAGQLENVLELRIGESIFEEEDQLVTDFGCARLSNGTVKCFGNGYQGQLGIDVGVGGASMSPTAIEGMPPGVIGLAVGERHACAATNTGTAVCWGDNTKGQVGIGAAAGDKIPRPSLVSLPNKVVQIVATKYDTCARLEGGDVYCWGRNFSRQAGSRQGQIAWWPKHVAFAHDSRSVAAGYADLCSIRSDGGITCWGGLDSLLGPEFAGKISANVPGISDATAMALGFSHACAIRKNATLWCWGAGEAGELGDGRRTNSWKPVQVPVPGPVVRVVAGHHSTCARLADRRWFCWGANRNAAIAPRRIGLISSPRLLDLSEL